MLINRTRHKGYSIISLLMVVVIIGILTSQYFSVEPTTGRTYQQSYTDRARTAVSIANLRQAETMLMMRTEGRRLPPEQLRTILQELPRGADAGRYFLDPNGQLQSTTQIEIPRFRDRYGLQRVR